MHLYVCNVYCYECASHGRKQCGNTGRECQFGAENHRLFIRALTGIAVAVTGSIGFVGLVIPHIVRSMVGADHKKVIPISTLLGAIFLIWVDVGARMFDAPGEIPIGIITAMIGAPIFLWMIRVRKYAFGKKEEEADRC